MQVWNDRMVSSLVNCKSELKARLLVLKHTRWKHYTLHNSAVLMEEMLELQRKKAAEKKESDKIMGQ